MLQLDFSFVVRLECVEGDSLAFEKTYTALTCLVVLVYAVALVVLPRVKVVQTMLSLDEQAKVRSKSAILYGQFTYRVGMWLVLTHAVSCRIALSSMRCLSTTLSTGNLTTTGTPGGVAAGVTTSEAPEDESAGCRNPAWWILFLVHGIGFPLVTLIGGGLVRQRLMGGACCRDEKATTEKQLANTRANGELGLWRYYLDYDMEARYHWFRTANMVVILTIVGAETSIRPRAKALAKEIGETDLSRTLLQAAAVATYLGLLCAARPYVNSRLRRWKLWVTASNQATTLLLILTRLLAEQARASTTSMDTVDVGYPSTTTAATTANASSSSSPPSSATMRPPIFTASLAFMYISTCFCILQFAVLIWSFLWSLFEGAKVEQVIIAKEIRKKKARVEAETSRRMVRQTFSFKILVLIMS